MDGPNEHGEEKKADARGGKLCDSRNEMFWERPSYLSHRKQATHCSGVVLKTG